MATDNQIVQATQVFQEAVNLLNSLKSRKQAAKADADALTEQIDAQQLVVDAARADLKSKL